MYQNVETRFPMSLLEKRSKLVVTDKRINYFAAEPAENRE
jgi:hypothetical protein